MKIINLKEFRKLPPYTLFSRYESCIFGNLEIKGNTLEDDFLTTGALSSQIECEGNEDYIDKLCIAQSEGKALKMSWDTMGRDGIFDKHQLFAVYEEEDVKSLIKHLQVCLNVFSPNNKNKGEGTEFLASQCST